MDEEVEGMTANSDILLTSDRCECVQEHPKLYQEMSL